MDRYQINLSGEVLLMHQDNLVYSEKVKAWQMDPANSEQNKTKGDDRVPAWTWIGYLYHNSEVATIPSDNLMTVIREGATKVRTGKKQETFKKLSQSGIVLDQESWPLLVGGKEIPVKPFEPLIGCNEFIKHIRAAEEAGFELFVKRVRIGQAKHVRVRPLFRQWSTTGTLTVIDPELSGIDLRVLEMIFNQAGALCGLCDWRPSAPKSPGPYGKFAVKIEKY